MKEFVKEICILIIIGCAILARLLMNNTHIVSCVNFLGFIIAYFDITYTIRNKILRKKDREFVTGFFILSNCLFCLILALVAFQLLPISNLVSDLITLATLGLALCRNLLINVSSKLINNT